MHSTSFCLACHDSPRGFDCMRCGSPAGCIDCGDFDAREVLGCDGVVCTSCARERGLVCEHCDRETESHGLCIEHVEAFICDACGTLGDVETDEHHHCAACAERLATLAVTAPALNPLHVMLLGSMIRMERYLAARGDKGRAHDLAKLGLVEAIETNVLGTRYQPSALGRAIHAHIVATERKAA